ncbi:alpha/beta hydrolase [Candidatus Woesearchaeota archaeon]|nr:alpha/beta hydrolase [Candidatus Woesearchaeota archaeon]
MSEEKISFKNSNGLKIVGVLERISDDKRVVILIHGYSSNKDRRSTKQLAEELSSRKINSFRLDLGGSGESEGDFGKQTISGWVDDVLSAIKLLESKGYSEFELFGSSAGGLVAMNVALAYPNVKRVALKAPVSDYPTQRLEHIGEKGIKDWEEKGHTIYVNGEGKEFKVNYSFFEDTKKHVMYDKVKDITCPVLIIHGDADTAVRVEQSKRVVKGFPDAKLVVLEGANHALEINGDKSYANKLFGDWFEKK